MGIVVEGQTEEAFVKDLLDAHLRLVGIEAEPVLLQGDVTVPRLATLMGLAFRRSGTVTSLVDYYGFRDKGSDGIDALERRIGTAVQGRLGQSSNPSLIIPYVQQYEFEALLFSRVSAFRDVLGLSAPTVSQLNAVREQFVNPEEINDSPDTAPSKRIVKILPYYNKVTYGPRIAQEIGLSTIRTQCPRFNSWLTRLESLAG